ncbi:MAG: HK97 family phage prohead protease [Pseudomonadota bacterium]
MEHRDFLGSLRASDAGEVSGIAAPYDAPTEYAGLSESFARGVFRETLDGNADVLALAHHDASKVLGRRASSTLRLQDAEDGLRFMLSLPDTELGREMRHLVGRGDIRGVSAGFNVTEDLRDGRSRVIKRANLVEISLVAMPAYGSTSVAVTRSRAGDHRRLRHADLIISTFRPL